MVTHKKPLPEKDFPVSDHKSKPEEILKVKFPMPISFPSTVPTYSSKDIHSFIHQTFIECLIPAIKIARRNINNLRYEDDTTLMAESEEELKSLLMKVKEESEKASLKFSIHKTEIMASGPITSWQIDGETMETVRDFIFGGSKITADGDCCHEIKRRLLLGRKPMTKLDSMLKSRDLYQHRSV